MMLSRACEYGIRAIIHLASMPEAGPVLVRQVAEDLAIPASFLAKIVQALAKRGFIRSHKGPGGGIALARPAEEMDLLQVIDAIDGSEFARSCFLGIPNCSDEAPCPLHDQWGAIRQNIVDMLGAKSVAGFAEQLKLQGQVLVRSFEDKAATEQRPGESKAE